METTCVWDDFSKRMNGEIKFGLWGNLDERFDGFWSSFWEVQISPYVESVLGENDFLLKNGARLRFVKDEDADCGLFFLGEEGAISTYRHKPCMVVMADVEGYGKKIEQTYGVLVSSMDGGNCPIHKLLLEFPIERIDVRLPSWVQALPQESALMDGLIKKLKEIAPKFCKIRDAFLLEECFSGDDTFLLKGLDADSSGVVVLTLDGKEGLFYEVLSKECNEDLSGDDKLMQYVISLSQSKSHYKRIEKAFDTAREYGYGMVMPCVEEMQLEEPKLVKKGSSYGVKFKGTSPSYHIIKVDVQGEVAPIVGTKEQGEEFVKESLEKYETDKDAVWKINIFGKSLQELLESGLYKKSDFEGEVKSKLRRALERIMNEGKGGVICILL